MSPGGPPGRAAAAPGGAAAPTPPAGAALALLPLAGIAFWFAVGFPWAPHNESYDWIVRLDDDSFVQALTGRFPSVLGVRPLATGLAWLLYRLGGRGVALAQLANVAFALGAWAALAPLASGRGTWALLALGSGAVFFSGYIWLFHLHGVFYGPLLVYAAGLARAACRPAGVRTLAWAFAATAVAALFHPYALPLFAAFALGAACERPALRTRGALAAAALALAATAGLYLLLVPADARHPAGSPLAGIAASFGAIEVSPLVSAFAAALIALGLLARPRPAGARGAAWTALELAAIAAAIAALRGTTAAFALSMAVAAAARGEWTLAALTGAALLLPAGNPTGSPTYAVPALLLATAGLARAVRVPWRPPPRAANRLAAAALAALALVAAALRAGLPLPVADRLARPLLAERERTYQLAAIVDSLAAPRWRTHPARLVRDAWSPVEAAGRDRALRPPTNQNHFATYLAHRRGTAAAAGDTLVVAFGGERVPGVPAFAVRGRWAGDALVFRRPWGAAPPAAGR